MREGALPSPATQARVLQDVLALSAREKFRVNLIEAYDQPWKRALEGTVGGHWGIISDARDFKFVWGEAVSNHPRWMWQAGGGVVLAVIVFGVAFFAGGKAPAIVWLAVTGNAIVSGALIGWTIANLPLESLGVSGWARSLALAIVTALSAPVVSAALMRGAPIPSFTGLLGPALQRIRDPLAIAMGVMLIAVTLLAVLTALGLVFDPRYKDFPFAPLTAAIVPFLLHTVATPRPAGARGVAEVLSAALLALSVPYIVLNESFGNWQSLWLCAALVALAVTLVQVRDARN
jgi:glucan 1,3-beta-glucosidase